MIKIIVIHDTELTNDEYKEKLLATHKYLTEYPDMYRIYVANITQGPRTKVKNFDKFYYDEETIKVQDIWDKYISKYASGDSSQIYPVSFDKKKKMTTRVITPIKQS